MPHRSHGLKKSEFPAEVTVLSGATFDYVVGDSNKKITFSDLLAELGATGTLVQDGDPLGTPILDIQGTVNNIRNLENGAGITTSVSAENGATIAHNFTVDATGEPIMQNAAAASPTFVSLVGNSPISVATVDEEIEISFIGGQVIVATAIAYQILVADDIISSTGTHNITLPNIVSAVKEVTIQSVSGTATILGDAAIQAPNTVAAGASITLFPASGQWWHK